jgi:CspA family cold shock protein
MTQTGKVIRFNRIKGYGFIAPDAQQAEVFVHFSQIQTTGYKELSEGQRVSFCLEEGDRGVFATQVNIIES